MEDLSRAQTDVLGQNGFSASWPKVPENSFLRLKDKCKKLFFIKYIAVDLVFHMVAPLPQCLLGSVSVTGMTDGLHSSEEPDAVLSSDA